MKIKISHLSIGLHEFDFEEKVERLNIEGSDRFPNIIYEHVKIDKEVSNLVVQIGVHTVAHLVCDRCLEEFDLEIGESLKILYSKEQPVYEYGERLVSYEEEARPYSQNMDILDITRDVRDALLLAVPMKILCKPDCKGLCPICGANLNKVECHHQVNIIDPRWEDLKKLLR